MNVLPLEDYVAGVVPNESPAYWGTLGGAGAQGQARGFQELEAQAVAARSYMAADRGGYGGYADTCDLSCQTYRGIANESPLTDLATLDTLGVRDGGRRQRRAADHRVLGLDRRLHGAGDLPGGRRRRRRRSARPASPAPATRTTPGTISIPVVDHRVDLPAAGHAGVDRRHAPATATATGEAGSSR